MRLISLRTIVAATESEDRVKTALSLFLFGDEIETIKTEGHFGNPITILQAQIKGRTCRRFIELLKSKLPENELGRLKKELGERIDDDCCLHIRFDKQAAYNGIVQLAAATDTIATQIKLKAYPARREKAMAVAEEFF
ncbi:MAG: RNA-binding domain-containing protein [Candidatus Methanoperedens sp.]|nr:RNA-binding domain-containing protein [Candidatus Methanoperedens sp.]